jgi:hypothetical protein
MNSCFDNLLNTPPREYAGSSTSASYDFQKDWAITLLLRSHDEDDDYLIFFDYHEDLIKFDSSTDPQQIYCYQVKKCDGNWTISKLTQQKTNKTTGEKSSILSKLLQNKKIFNHQINRMYFISNGLFNVKLENDESSSNRKSICFTELTEEERKKTLKCMESFDENELGAILNQIYLERTNVPYPGSDTYVRGALSQFIEARFPDTRYSINPIYITLFDEVKRRTAHAYRLENREDFNKKSITKQEFNTIIHTMISIQDYVSIFDNQVLNRLNSEKVSIVDIRLYQSAIKTIQVKLSDKTNLYYHAILEELKKYLESDFPESLVTGAQNFHSYLVAKDSKYNLVDSNEIKSLYMVKVYG